MLYPLHQLSKHSTQSHITHIHSQHEECWYSTTYIRLQSLWQFLHMQSVVYDIKNQSQQNLMQAANVHWCHPVTPGQPHSGLAWCRMQRTACSTRIALSCIANGDDSAVFCFFLFLLTWPVTFELWRDFCTTYLTAKFDDPTFSRSEVIVRTNKQTHTLTNKQTPLKTSTLLRYAMPVGKHRTCIFTGSRWPMPMINSFRLISITQISRSHDP